MNLDYALVNVDGKFLLNHEKITKEDAFEIIKENSLKVILDSEKEEFSDKCSIPPNFDAIKALLDHEGVYAASTTKINNFQDEKNIGEISISIMKSGDVHGIVKDVMKFVGRGLNVYIHSYYIMNADRYIDDDLTVKESWFWYKLGFKKI